MPHTRTDRGWGDIPREQKLEQVLFLSVPEGVLFVFDQGMVRVRTDDAGKFFLSYYPANVPECWEDYVSLPVMANQGVEEVEEYLAERMGANRG